MAADGSTATHGSGGDTEGREAAHQQYDQQQQQQSQALSLVAAGSMDGTLSILDLASGAVLGSDRRACVRVCVCVCVCVCVGGSA